MNHYPRDGYKEILNSPSEKFLILDLFMLHLHQADSQHPIKYVELNASSTSLIRKISTSKHYIAEKPQIKFQVWIYKHAPVLKFHLGMVNPACLSPLL